MSKQISVVHGLDEDMKNEVTGILKKIGLSPVIMNEDDDDTWLTSPTSLKDISYALVLLSDDEVGTLREQFPKNVTLRASQKCVMQTGLLLALLGADNVLIIHHRAKNFQLPLEHPALKCLMFDAEGRWQFELARHLKQAGFAIDANQLL